MLYLHLIWTRMFILSKLFLYKLANQDSVKPQPVFTAYTPSEMITFSYILHCQLRFLLNTLEIKRDPFSMSTSITTIHYCKHLGTYMNESARPTHNWPSAFHKTRWLDGHSKSFFLKHFVLFMACWSIRTVHKPAHPISFVILRNSENSITPWCSRDAFILTHRVSTVFHKLHWINF